jgi:hypothetical protein
MASAVANEILSFIADRYFAYRLRLWSCIRVGVNSAVRFWIRSRTCIRRIDGFVSAFTECIAVLE